MDTLFQDLRHAFRQLGKAPGFTAVAAGTLALGIGANAAIFALVDATLLRPLPLPDPGRLVMIWERTESSAREGVSPGNLVDWNERSRTFDRIAGFIPSVAGMVMSGRDGIPENVSRQWVTAGFFDVLGVQPITGRTFLPSDNRSESDVVVLSEGFWRARFGANRGVVGRDLRLDGEPYTVVGVVPEEAQLLGRTSIWAMIPIGGGPQEDRSAHYLQAIGRLKPGVALEAADADLAAVALALAREFPKTNAGRGVAMAPLHDAVIGGDLRLTSMLFLGVVGFVLLICCANVASLLLARATARRREMAIRSALGAGRGHLIRQLLTESLVLAAVGGALALGVGAAILGVAPSLVPEGLLPGAVTPAFDLRVVVFCAATTLLVGVLFGLAPAWQAAKLSPARVVASGGRATTGRGAGIRGVLVAAEVAVAVLLLVGAGLLLRTLIAVDQVDRGYRAEGVLTMMVDPLGDEYYPTDDALLGFFAAVEREVATLPGVRGVAWATTLPLGESSIGSESFEVVGAPPVDESQRPSADYQIVSPAYFRTLGLSVVAGREFSDRDRDDSVPVCIVNEAFVRRHLQGRSPIGQRLEFWWTQSAGEPDHECEIVGVARQVKGRPAEAEDLVQVYVPMAQDPVDDMFLLVRSASERPEGLGASVRAAIARVDREQLVGVRDVATLEDVAWEATARHRFRAVVVVTFAVLALVLAMVGVFGILAYAVQQRVRDFGVRRALGATTPDVLRLVFASAARVIGIGALIGLALAALLGRLLATVLFGVTPLDPLTYALVAVVLLVTAALSAAAPAWRATRVDPAVALRNE